MVYFVEIYLPNYIRLEDHDRFSAGAAWIFLRIDVIARGLSGRVFF